MKKVKRVGVSLMKAIVVIVILSVWLWMMKSLYNLLLKVMSQSTLMVIVVVAVIASMLTFVFYNDPGLMSGIMINLVALLLNKCNYFTYKQYRC